MLVNIYICVYVNMYIYDVCVCKYIYMIYVYVNMYIYDICVCKYIYICIYACLYIQFLANAGVRSSELVGITLAAIIKDPSLAGRALTHERSFSIAQMHNFFTVDLDA